MVTYFYRGHWIALMIALKWGKVWVLDSRPRLQNLPGFLGCPKSVITYRRYSQFFDELIINIHHQANYVIYLLY
jgi:hypothetical protein